MGKTYRKITKRNDVKNYVVLPGEELGKCNLPRHDLILLLPKKSIDRTLLRMIRIPVGFNI